MNILWFGDAKMLHPGQQTFAGILIWLVSALMAFCLFVIHCLDFLIHCLDFRHITTDHKILFTIILDILVIRPSDATLGSRHLAFSLTCPGIFLLFHRLVFL
jgi:hypothetical protein